MARRPRQLLLVADGEDVRLPPEVAAKAAKAMGRLILQVLRAEGAPDPRGGRREGEGDDSRS
jgi:hypothetical protein